MTNVPEDIVDNLAFTTIRASAIHGLGLFASEDIPKGTQLGILDGQVIPYPLHQKFELTFEWNALDSTTLLVRPYRTKYSYINHSRTPNLKLTGYPLKIISLVDIKVGVELTLDYRKEQLPDDYIDKKGKYYL